MAGQSYIQVPADSVGKKVDCVSLSASGQAVMRQVVVLGGPGSGDSQNYVTVVAGALTIGGNINAISRTLAVTGTVAISGAVTVNGTIDKISAAVVLAAGTNNIGTVNNISAAVAIASLPNVNISAMPAVVIAAGTNNIGFINGISATVNVAGTFTISTIDKISATVVAQITSSINLNISAMPAVALAAGAANIGFINNISATVNVAGTVAISGTVPVSGTIDKISAAVVLAAGVANIGFINGISATVVAQITSSINLNISAMPAVVLAAGTNNIGTVNNISAAIALAAGVANIGFINNISAAVRTYQGSLAVPSASHGPKVVTLSTSAAVALVAAPGAALSIYIDNIVVTNGSGTLTRVDIYDASNTAACIVCGFAAASGGGFSTNLNPPAKVSANTALNVRVKPNVSDVIVTINFHVEA